MLHQKKNISVMGDIFCFMLKIPNPQHSNPVQLWACTNLHGCVILFHLL